MKSTARLTLAAKPWPDPAESGHTDQLDIEQWAPSDAAGSVFQELLPKFEGMLPLAVIRECVDRAVRDLHGSISAEALPEMAIRLAAVRLEKNGAVSATFSA